jgi:hypothetical protein
MNRNFFEKDQQAHTAMYRGTAVHVQVGATSVLPSWIRCCKLVVGAIQITPTKPCISPQNWLRVEVF